MGFQDDKLILSYLGDTDTLSLWNVIPASEAGDLIAGGALDVNGDAQSLP